MYRLVTPCRTNLELLEEDARPTSWTWGGEASHHPSEDAPLGPGTSTGLAPQS